MTVVDEYWNRHVVGSKKHFDDKNESIKFSEWRLNHTPFHREFMKYEELHENEVILDYGCGPGNDIVNFILYSEPKKIIGMDISRRALDFAKRQTVLYDTSIEIEFIKITDGNERIPLASESIDYIFCSGVLQHTSNPDKILKEFYRILKPNKMARIMVYNRNSIWFHVYVADEKKFPKTTDGTSCPIVIAWKPEDFISMCEDIGFQAEFLGGYFASHKENMALFKRRKPQILADKNVAQEHKDFINRVEIKDSYFWYNGKTCGIGGVYELYRR